MKKALRLTSITKTFPGNVIANNNISLEIYEGEIHSIVGENGAGKTTLMKIISGLLKPDNGEIYLYGQKVKLSSPSDAVSHKIGMVHQHFMLIPRFTVAENIALGMEKRKGLNIDKEEINKYIKTLSARYGFNIDTTSTVEDLSVGGKQKVEILKVLYRNANIIIFDEPTSVLSPNEIEELFKIFRLLIKDGKSVLFISHKLKEVLEISNRITILKKGKKIGTLLRSEATSNKLAEMMTGTKQSIVFQNKQDINKKAKIPHIKLENVESTGATLDSSLKGISMEINGGEILGIAGVEGNGQKVLVEVIIGIIPLIKGRIFFEGIELSNLSPVDRRKMGIGLIPEDRQKEGLLLDTSVKENLFLGHQYRREYYDKVGTIKEKYIDNIFLRIMKKYNVQPPDINAIVANLSGGNQQRVVLGREMYYKPKFLVAMRPTRGLDISSTIFIHEKLVEIKNKGSSVLLISFDLDELIEISDRIAVMYEGMIIDIFINEEPEKSRSRIGLALGGVKSGNTMAK